MSYVLIINSKSIGLVNLIAVSRVGTPGWLRDIYVVLYINLYLSVAFSSSSLR